MIHDLKILPEYFEAVLSGDKSFEVRSIADRTFNPGDDLRLREWHYSAEIMGANGGYSGREVYVKVTYVLPGIIYKGAEAVVMSIMLMNDPRLLKMPDIAKGEELDYWGHLLGVKRNGDPDADYRDRLLAKVRGV